MKIANLGALVCLGLVAMVACSEDEGGSGGEAGMAGSAGSSGAAGGGGKGQHTGGAPGDAGAGGGGDETIGDAGTPGTTGGAGGAPEEDSPAGAGGVAGAGAGGDSGSPDPLAHCDGCTRSKIGSPLWEPTGILAITGELGTDLDSYVEFLSSFVEPNHAWDDNDFLVAPAVAHAGPYDDELFELATTAGYVAKQTFTEEEFTAPNGVTIMMNFIPSAGAATGSSFDFASGPIIPNALFPIDQEGGMFRNGVIYDDAFENSFAGFHELMPPIVKEGASHFVWFFGESTFFGPPDAAAAGSYELRLNFIDSTGAGWRVTVPFTVTD
jgi:hypothetical protein